MTAPVGCDIRERLETMRNAVVDLLFVRVRLGIGLADTLGDDARVTLDVTCVLAVLALHAGAALEEIAAEGTAHNVVELPLDKLVAVHLVHLLLALPDGTFSAQTKVDGAAIRVLLEEAQAQLDLPGRLEVEPGRDGLLGNLGLGLQLRSAVH